MVKDYGFELPDTRHTFFDKDEQAVTVIIVRHWYQDDPEDEPNFRVSFNIVRGNEVTNLPIGTREEQAIDIAHKLYEEDEELTRANDEIEALYDAERAVGA